MDEHTEATACLEELIDLLCNRMKVLELGLRSSTTSRLSLVIFTHASLTYLTSYVILLLSSLIHTTSSLIISASLVNAGMLLACRWESEAHWFEETMIQSLMLLFHCRHATPIAWISARSRKATRPAHPSQETEYRRTLQRAAHNLASTLA